MTNLEVPRNICPSQNPSCSRKEDRKDGCKSLLSPEVRPEVVLKGVCCNTRQQTIKFTNKPRHGPPRRRSLTFSTPSTMQVDAQGETVCDIHHSAKSLSHFLFYFILCLTLMSKVNWCFTPTQPVWLYQGDDFDENWEKWSMNWEGRHLQFLAAGKACIAIFCSTKNFVMKSWFSAEKLISASGGEGDSTPFPFIYIKRICTHVASE